MKYTIIMSLIMCAFCCKAQPDDTISEQLLSCLTKYKIIGMAVSVVDCDSILYKKGFGYANRNTKTPYTTQTVQPIASISKTLIAISLLKAQEMNMLKLDDYITDYMPFEIKNPHFDNEKITIRHLATHTSGLKDDFFNYRSYLFADKLPPIYKKTKIGVKRLMIKNLVNKFNSNSKIPLEEFLKNYYHPTGKWYSKKNFAKSKPGDNFLYCNNGSAIAAMVIEKASGMNYKDFVNKYVTSPLKMEKSGWDMANFDTDKKSRLYFVDNEIPEYELITYPDGGFVTCVDDLNKYIMTVMRGYKGEDNILSAASYAEMLSPQMKPEHKTGIFWDIKSTSIGHSGADPGIITFAYFKKDATRGIIIITNSTDEEMSGKCLSEIVNILKKI